MPVNHEGVDHLFSWEGDVGRTVLARVLQFEEVARVNAPYRPDSIAPHLADSIGHEVISEPGKLVVLVGTNPDQNIRGYSTIVQSGSRPHIITPIPPNKRLRFKVAGRTVYATRVFHPGTQPDPFLMRWIEILTA